MSCWEYQRMNLIVSTEEPNFVPFHRADGVTLRDVEDGWDNFLLFKERQATLCCTNIALQHCHFLCLNHITAIPTTAHNTLLSFRIIV